MPSAMPTSFLPLWRFVKLQMTSETGNEAAATSVGTETATERAPWQLFRSIGTLLRWIFSRSRKSAVPYEWFNELEVAGLDSAGGLDDSMRIDDQTWHDIEVPALLEQLGGRASLLGRQHLYRRLRRGGGLAVHIRDGLTASGKEASDRILALTQPVRDELRRQDKDAVPAMFHGGLPHVPGFARYLWLPPLALALSLIVAVQITSGLLASSAAIAYLITFGAAQIKLAEATSKFKEQRRTILTVVDAARGLANIGRRYPHPLLDSAIRLESEALRLRSSLSLNFLESIPQLLDTVNLLTLYECLTLQAKVDRLRRDLPSLCSLYEMVAECEASLCVLEALRDQHGTVCWARHGEERTLSLKGMYNPLFSQPEKLTVELDGKGAFITGENGVGKSTFLRTIGLSILTARAFGYCHADEAIVPRLPVWSSIKNEDSRVRSESLYMAELRRAETLLRVSRQTPGAVFLIDEVFRGTNNLESVSAAAAVIHRLAASSLVVVSSHNLVLAPLLHSSLRPMRIVREEKLQLESGVLAETNGLRMMERYEFDTSIRADAGRIFDWFSQYVTLPIDFPELR